MRSTRRLQAVFRTLFIVVNCAIIGNIRSANICPSELLIQPCKCADQTGELQIWCSYSDLPRLMEALKTLSRHIPKEIDELIIENNLLPSLPGQVFSSLKIYRLMLRNNGLQQIALNWLSGLETILQEIYIVEPDLRNFPDDSLLTLPRLEALTLSAGSITKMPAIFGLSRLRYIQIEAPSMEDVVIDNFQSLPFLEQLHVTSATRFHRLEPEFLHDLPKLSILNFTESGLSSIHGRALTRLPMLTELFLTGNKFRDARAVGMAIRDMPNLSTVRLDRNLIDKLEEASFVDMPSLRNLYLSDNKITNVYRAAFHRLPSLRSLDLSNNQLKTIHPESFLPSGESNVEELRLANNNVEQSRVIRLLLDLLPRLRLLDFSRNHLQDISFGILQGHTHLEILHLEHNAIQRIDKEAFIGLPSLRELKLMNNSLSNYLRVPFWNLPALKGLDISHNKFNHLDETIMNGLPSLRRFDISANLLKTVDPMTFIITPNLEHINMSHNSIDILVPSTFTHLQKLFDLDLSYNNFSQIISGLPKSTEYLYMSHNEIPIIPSSASNDLQLSSLKLLDLSENKIHHILPESFNALCMLRTLHLNGNMLQKLDQSMLSGLAQLRILNLANNKLIIVNKDSFKQMKHLIDLNLSGNRLEIIDVELLSQNTELKELDISRNRLLEPIQANFTANKKIEELNMSHNSLTEFPMVITTMTSIRMLDLSHNQIKTLPHNMLPLMPSLKELRLSRNKLQVISEGIFEKSLTLSILNLENNEIEKMTSHAIKTLPNLATINLSKNKLSTIPSSTFTNLPSLQVIELQDNQLTNIANDAFTACPNLMMLNLSHNLLSDVDKSGFRRIRNLEALDLSHNRISQFQSTSMQDMNFLVMLKVDNNRLCNIEGSPFEGMSRLRILSLRDNKMTSLPENTFRKLRSSFMYLDIEGNPIRCSCNMLWLHSWLQKDDINFPGPRCSDGILLRDHRISRINCEDTVTDVVPGCDSRGTSNNVTIISTMKPTKGTSSFNVITFKPDVINITENSKPLLPLPEETDYFDPKYVEYNENNSSKNVPNTKKPIPPEILSHYIPGDTPTVYAGMRPRGNATFNDPAYNTQSTVNGSGFTFFGVPIPSLNLNNFWNTGKFVDKSRLEGSNYPRIPQSTPEIEKNGFIPMLPGIGGFTPVTNLPVTTIQENKAEFQNPYVNRSWHKSSNYIPGHATVSKIALSIPHNEPANADEQLNGISSTLHSNIISRDSLFESSTAINVNRPLSSVPNANNSDVNRQQINQQTNERNYTAKTGNIPNNKIYPKEYSTNNSNHNNIQIKIRGPTRQTEENYLHASTINRSKSNEYQQDKFSPSPLTGFLAPGGQLSATPSSSTSRTNVAKIQLVSGPSPHTEDVQSSHLRLAKSSFQSTTTEVPISTTDDSVARKTKYPENSSFDWYFDNYNQSDIEPYIGKPIYFSISNRNKCLLPLHMLSILYLAYHIF